MLLILPPSSVVLTTHPKALITTMTTFLVLAIIKITVVIFVTMTYLEMEAHKVLLLGTNSTHNNNISLTSSEVGLYHHGSCHYVRILLISILSLLLLPINREFWANILRLMLPQLHQHPLTSQLLCIPCIPLLRRAHGTWTHRRHKVISYLIVI